MNRSRIARPPLNSPNVMDTTTSASHGFDQTPLAWLSKGGVSHHGMQYRPPRHAHAWGDAGCPLVPRALRNSLGSEKLPTDFNSALGATLTVGELDAGVLRRCGFEKIPHQARDSLRRFLNRLRTLEGWVVIPAGIPKTWFEALPVSSRTQRVISRAFSHYRIDSDFSRPLMASEFLAIKGAGLAALNETTCVIESAEVDPQTYASSEETAAREDREFTETLARIFGDEDANDTQFYDFTWLDDPQSAGILESAALPTLDRQPPSGNLQRPARPGPNIENSLPGFLINFAKWAMAETGATSLGEAIAGAIQRSPGPDEWNEMAAAQLADFASPSLHPYEILTSWADQLDPRENTVFTSRVAALRRSRTLEEIAHEFGVTRERVRQIEVRVRKKLNRFLASRSAIPIIWRANSVRRKLRVAAPETMVDELLAPPEDAVDYRAIILDLAGPYRPEEDGWLINRSALERDPTPTILAKLDEVGRVDDQLARLELSEWGLDDSLHTAWLLRCQGIREFNGRLVKWGSAIPDRLAFALADLGHPATIDDLMEHVAEPTSKNSAINALSGDPRIIRVSPTEWALASWGSPEYTGTAHSMRVLLEEKGGSYLIDQLVLKMDQTFGVSEGTTRAYCNAPMFIVDGEWLRLRTHQDEPYRCDADSIRKTPGVFDLGHGRLGRMIEVDENTLRGSGMLLTEAAGAILNVKVNDNLAFSGQHGARVGVTFPETSLVGPSLGSIKSLAERVDATIGDYITLMLDRSDMSLMAEISDATNCGRDWETIGRMTGIGMPMDLGMLARALHCSDSEVRNILRQRGDDQILECLPQAPPSSSLDEALAALEAQIDRT